MLREWPFAYGGDFLLGQKESPDRNREQLGILLLLGVQAYNA